MSGIALVLMALAVSDLTHGLEGTPSSRAAAMRGAAIGTWWASEGSDADLSNRLDDVLPFIGRFSDDAKLLLLAGALLLVD